MPRRQERGFALPLTVFVLVLITLLLSAAFVRVGAELRVSRSGGDMADALAIAQSGMAQYQAFHSARGVAPADGDSVFFASIPPGGTAAVTAQVVRVDTSGQTTYLLRSVGTRIDPASGAAARAIRTVTQLAEWRSDRIVPEAAFVTYRRLSFPDTTSGRGRGRGRGQGPSGEGTLITIGTDGSACAWPTVPGLDDNGVGGANRLYNFVGVDWPTVVATGFAAQHTSLQQLGTWASYLIDGDLTLTTSGNGLLVVRGALTTSGNAVTWDGAVLVGDSAVFDARTTTINGMLMTNLNAVLPGRNPAASIVMATRTLQVFYDGCRVDSAFAPLTRRFQVISNTWFDRWMAN